MKYFNVGSLVILLIVVAAGVSGAFHIEPENSLHHGDGAGCRGGGGGHRRRGGRPTPSPQNPTDAPEEDGAEEIDV